MSGVVVVVAVVTVVVVAVSVASVVRVTRRQARVNALLDAAHQARLRNWSIAARSGRGDPPAVREPLALPARPASRESGVSS